jgi:quinol monooxygenase YgiN
MSKRVTLNCQLKSEQLPLLLPFLENNLPNVRGFNGCIAVNVYLDDTQSEMLLEEEWETTEHHGAYIEYIKNNGVLAELAQFLTSPPTIKYFNGQDI